MAAIVIQSCGPNIGQLLLVAIAAGFSMSLQLGANS